MFSITPLMDTNFFILMLDILILQFDSTSKREELKTFGLNINDDDGGGSFRRRDGLSAVFDPPL